MLKSPPRWPAIAPNTELLDIGGVQVVWLPANVNVTEPESVLLPEELAYAQTIKAKARRAEYIRSRWLVRTCLQTSEPLPRGPSGEPSWPKPLLGSITHKEGHCGITQAPAQACIGIGIDAENPERVHAGLANKILQAEELDLLNRIAGAEEEFGELLATCFSFKESLFKSHFPLGQRMFYFHDAMIETLCPDSGRISARVLTDTSPASPAGHVTQGAFVWHQSDNLRLVITTAVLHENATLSP